MTAHSIKRRGVERNLIAWLKREGCEVESPNGEDGEPRMHVGRFEEVGFDHEQFTHPTELSIRRLAEAITNGEF